MPGLDSQMHLDMFKQYKKHNYSLPVRILRAIKREIFSKDIYGTGWGHIDYVPPLKYVKEKYVLPYVNANSVGLEIGVGGGRWTQYLLGFKQVYLVDFYQELLDEVKKNYGRANMAFIKNNGTDFPGVSNESIDYIFSFGTFVHLDLDVIDSYLKNIRFVLKPGGNAVIHYADKTKIMGQLAGEGFSDNSPEKMRTMVLKHNFQILEEDLTSLWHSNLIRFTI